MMTLELTDIQGNIHRPYGRFGFPFTRHFFFNIADPVAGRRFVENLRPLVTTAAPWGVEGVLRPAVPLNIGFTYAGLHALKLPTRTLRLMPDEFIDGMPCRAAILGDAGDSALEHWDPIWRGAPSDNADQVHVWVSINAAAKPDGTPVDDLDASTAQIIGFADVSGGAITLLAGHGEDGTARWQDSAAIMDSNPDGTRHPVPREHFGFTDGISDPVFRGQIVDPTSEKIAVIGGGKLAEGTYDAMTSWSALEAGEFILGQVDEGQELPVATQPANFARNGTFMVWRKLKQNVAAFDADIAAKAVQWQAVNPGTTEEEASETLRAKIVGRWRNGIPLSAAPTWAEYKGLEGEYEACIEIALRKSRTSEETKRLAKFNLLLTGFRYGDDTSGAKCPLGAHIRRANPRDMLDPKLSPTVGATTLTNRRRIIRRGLPYVDMNGDKGIVFMAICSSLFRQFEFIQQQWMNYGLDFDSGNDTCPLIGGRSISDKHVIPGTASSVPGGRATAPFIASALPEFVVTRGGDYFFLPSMTALRMIAMGTVDPT